MKDKIGREIMKEFKSKNIQLFKRQQDEESVLKIHKF